MRKVLGFSLLALALASGSAFAGDNTGSMQVSAEAVNTCYIQTATLDFGEVPAVVNTDIDVAGDIELQCSPDTSWTIFADNGVNTGSSTFGGRAMMGTAGSIAALDYDLFSDAGYTSVIVWEGSGGANSGIAGVAGAAGGVQSVPIYGRILAGQIVEADSLSDTVGLTVSF